MKKVTICIILGIILTINGCNQPDGIDEYIKIKEFPSLYHLSEPEKIFSDEIRNFFIQKIDSFLIISSDTEPFLKIYNEQEEYLLGIGRRGRGPNEFSHVLDIDVYNNGDGAQIIAYDYMLLKLYLININQSIEQEKLIVDKTYELPKELRGVTDIFYSNREQARVFGVYDDLFDKKLNESIGAFSLDLVINDLKTANLTSIKVEPFDLNVAMNINNSPSAVSDDKTKMAVTMLYQPIVSIFNQNLELERKILIEKSEFTNQIATEDFIDNEIEPVYVAIQATDNYVYLLKKEDDGLNSIQQIDWDGKPISEFLLPDNLEIGNFEIDEQMKIFYLISYVEDSIYKISYP